MWRLTKQLGKKRAAASYHPEEIFLFSIQKNQVTAAAEQNIFNPSRPFFYFMKRFLLIVSVFNITVTF